MQHTENYQFNLIERDDTFSPDALNENVRKLEAALDAAQASAAAGTDSEAAARAAADAALDARVAKLEAHRFSAGVAPDSGTVNLGFTPKAVLAYSGSGIGLALPGGPLTNTLNIVSGGFTCGGYFAHCRYVALA